MLRGTDFDGSRVRGGPRASTQHEYGPFLQTDLPKLTLRPLEPLERTLNRRSDCIACVCMPARRGSFIGVSLAALPQMSLW